MTTNETITRVYRETVASYGVEGVDRPEAEAAAIATLMVEVRAGRLEVDLEQALRMEIRKADEADGRSADAMLRRMAQGDVPLTLADFDVVVTLGAGRRKPWGMVTPEDLDTMNQIRYRNYKAARESFQEFNSNVIAVQHVVVGFKTMLDAFEAGAFDKERAVA